MDQLQELFQSFCNFGAGQRGAYQMTNAMFAKFCKDSRVLDRKFTATDADLLFSKIKPKGGRTISFDCFRYQGVPEIALKKGIKTDELVERMLSNHGPTSSGTVGDNVRFHDDKSQYTGVHKNGGPTNVDLGTSDLAFITNRGEADVRGSNIVYDKKIPQREAPRSNSGTHSRPTPSGIRPAAGSSSPRGGSSSPRSVGSPSGERPTSQQMARATMIVGGASLGSGPSEEGAGADKPAPKFGRRSGEGSSSPTRAGRTAAPGTREGRSGSLGRGSASPGRHRNSSTPSGSPIAHDSISAAALLGNKHLLRLFETFISFGAGQHGKSEMDNSRFAKFCKDAKLYDRTFTAIDADLLFSKVKPKGQRVIGFEVWVSVALPEIARRKNMQTADLVKKLEGLSPSTNATEADNVRFHDDKSQYTGVYKAGGPTNVDLGTSDLRYITNRAPADVRGVQQAS